MLLYFRHTVLDTPLKAVISPLDDIKLEKNKFNKVWYKISAESNFSADDLDAFVNNVEDYDDAKMALGKDDVIYMHPLPADREIEVSNSVIDGRHSVVFDQAENRMHAQKAVMALTMR